MTSDADPVVFVWPGDLHLTRPELENHRVALWMADEVNALIRPDFVQFAGDNSQDATEEQFLIFRDICSRLLAPFHALVGDHDVHHDPQAHGYRTHVGEPYGSFSLRGFRFIRLNTMEHRPLGLSREQTLWFRYEVDRALVRGEKVVLFQHHYPYQIWEDFDGPGIDDWREVVQTRRITAIFAGHTHYGQIANDRRNVAIASRSIGDPEGGPPGYSVVYLHGDDLAVRYRSVEDRGPFALITHPRDELLALTPRHIISGPDAIHVRIWSTSTPGAVEARIDERDWVKMESRGGNDWGAALPGDHLKKGEHALEVRAADAQGQAATDRICFLVDRTGRFTAVPRARPSVTQTAFC
jgi:Icc protein